MPCYMMVACNESWKITHGWTKKSALLKPSILDRLTAGLIVVTNSFLTGTKNDKHGKGLYLFFKDRILVNFSFGTPGRLLLR